MVLVGDTKYACETCIKGHRSSSCQHTDRPLFEIKRKGRPVTQCEHCRELRKTRQIHVKCACESRNNGPEASSSRGGSRLPARAAFPSGLPEDLLGASVASHPEGSESDESNRGCSCKEGTTCTCWTPRERAKTSARGSERRGFGASSSSRPSGDQLSEPAALAIHAHASRQRPVLPKPSADASSARIPHSPAIYQGGHSPMNGLTDFDSYSRRSEQSPAVDSEMTETSPVAYQGSLNYSQVPSPSYDRWPTAADSSFVLSPVSSSTCGCGSSCSCAGCAEHQGRRADSSAPCANPNECGACLECNINSLATLGTDAARTMFDPTQMQEIDEWLQQSSSLHNIPPSSSYDPQFGMPFIPSMTLPYATWQNVPSSPMPPQFSPPIPEECCGGRCKCPRGLCTCPPDCCGCCEGCQCTDCVHDTPSARSITFATSGERAPCCGGRTASTSPSSPGSPGIDPNPTSPFPNLSRNAGGSWEVAAFNAPRMPVGPAPSSSRRHSSSATSPHNIGRLEGLSPQPTPMDVAARSFYPSTAYSGPDPPQAPPHSRRRGSETHDYRTNSSQRTRPF